MSFARRAAVPIVLSLAMFLAARPVAAQSRLAEAAARDSGRTSLATQAAAGSIDSAAAVGTLAKPAGSKTGQLAPYRMPPLREAMFANLHNKLIHLPIVLALAAALLLILARRRPELEAVAFWTVWLAALASLAAYFSGFYQVDEFKGEPKEWLAALHEKSGIATGIAHAVWVLLLLRQPGKRYAWIWGILVVAMVAVAAFLGGELAHGE